MTTERPKIDIGAMDSAQAIGKALAEAQNRLLIAFVDSEDLGSMRYQLSEAKRALRRAIIAIESVEFHSEKSGE